MGLYGRYILPRFYDRVMDKPHLAAHRQRVLGGAAGSVLEIGVGTGLNLPLYPVAVERIATVEPNAGMDKRLASRIEQAPCPVDRHLLGAEGLPFDDGAFDCVVSTWTLCSIKAVGAALAEIHRVLRPGGRYIFLEHGLAEDERTIRWQRRLNWLQRLVADGCRIDLRIDRLVRAQPFARVELERFTLEDTPRVQAAMYEGVATKAVG